MSVLTVGGVVARPVRRVVPRRPVVLAPVEPVWVELGIPSWVAPQCQGDPLFPKLVSYSLNQLIVCLMGSPMPMRAGAGDLTLDDVAWWALEGLRALGGARVRRLTLAMEQAEAPFIRRCGAGPVPPGFFRDWTKARAEATEGVVTGSVRHHTATTLARYLMFDGFRHRQEPCYHRGICRHCYPQNFTTQTQTRAVASTRTEVA